MSNIEWFTNLRYGMFIHFGVYSMIGRGEWVMNREAISREEYGKIAEKFNPVNFNAEFICDLAVKAGMKYIVFTTMHHDGFRMYNSELTDYNSVKMCGRDFTAEIIENARKYGLKIGLYHSLNNWYDLPDAVDALEDKNKYKIFIDSVFKRIEELLVKYNPVDILWYDGWWPFDADGWQAEKMNRMALNIQSHLIFNGRNGLPGDFSTPEGHITAPKPWRPWEACITLNDHWGYHIGDRHWKQSSDVIDMLIRVANGRGNLLLNIGPAGDGSIPKPTVNILTETGQWIKDNSPAVFGTDIFTFDLRKRGGGFRADWSSNGDFTASGNNLYFIFKYNTGAQLIIAGLETRVKQVSLLSTGEKYPFIQSGRKLIINNLPDKLARMLYPVLKIECDSPPNMYLCGGLRVPNVPHPHYDPLPSNIQL